LQDPQKQTFSSACGRKWDKKYQKSAAMKRFEGAKAQSIRRAAAKLIALVFT